MAMAGLAGASGDAAAVWSGWDPEDQRAIVRTFEFDRNELRERWQAAGLSPEQPRRGAKKQKLGWISGCFVPPQHTLQVPEHHLAITPELLLYHVGGSRESLVRVPLKDIRDISSTRVAAGAGTVSKLVITVHTDFQQPFEVYGLKDPKLLQQEVAKVWQEMKAKTPSPQKKAGFTQTPRSSARRSQASASKPGSSGRQPPRPLFADVSDEQQQQSPGQEAPPAKQQAASSAGASMTFLSPFAQPHAVPPGAAAAALAADDGGGRSSTQAGQPPPPPPAAEDSFMVPAVPQLEGCSPPMQPEDTRMPSAPPSALVVPGPGPDPAAGCAKAPSLAEPLRSDVAPHVELLMLPRRTGSPLLTPRLQPPPAGQRWRSAGGGEADGRGAARMPSVRGGPTTEGGAAGAASLSRQLSEAAVSFRSAVSQDGEAEDPSIPAVQAATSPAEPGQQLQQPMPVPAPAVPAPAALSATAGSAAMVALAAAAAASAPFSLLGVTAAAAVTMVAAAAVTQMRTGSPTGKLMASLGPYNRDVRAAVDMLVASETESGDGESQPGSPDVSSPAKGEQQLHGQLTGNAMPLFADAAATIHALGAGPQQQQQSQPDSPRLVRVFLAVGAAGGWPPFGSGRSAALGPPVTDTAVQTDSPRMAVSETIMLFSSATPAMADEPGQAFEGHGEEQPGEEAWLDMLEVEEQEEEEEGEEDGAAASPWPRAALVRPQSDPDLHPPVVLAAASPWYKGAATPSPAASARPPQVQAAALPPFTLDGGYGDSGSSLEGEEEEEQEDPAEAAAPADGAAPSSTAVSEAQQQEAQPDDDDAGTSVAPSSAAALGDEAEADEEAERAARSVRTPSLPWLVAPLYSRHSALAAQPAAVHTAEQAPSGAPMVAAAAAAGAVAGAGAAAAAASGASTAAGQQPHAGSRRNSRDAATSTDEDEEGAEEEQAEDGGAVYQGSHEPAGEEDAGLLGCSLSGSMTTSATAASAQDAAAGSPGPRARSAASPSPSPSPSPPSRGSAAAAAAAAAAAGGLPMSGNAVDVYLAAARAASRSRSPTPTATTGSSSASAGGGGGGQRIIQLGNLDDLILAAQRARSLNGSASSPGSRRGQFGEDPTATYGLAAGAYLLQQHQHELHGVDEDEDEGQAQLQEEQEHTEGEQQQHEAPAASDTLPLLLAVAATPSDLPPSPGGPGGSPGRNSSVWDSHSGSETPPPEEEEEEDPATSAPSASPAGSVLHTAAYEPSEHSVGWTAAPLSLPLPPAPSFSFDAARSPPLAAVGEAGGAPEPADGAAADVDGATAWLLNRAAAPPSTAGSAARGAGEEADDAADGEGGEGDDMVWLLGMAELASSPGPAEAAAGGHAHHPWGADGAGPADAQATSRSNSSIETSGPLSEEPSAFDMEGVPAERLPSHGPSSASSPRSPGASSSSGSHDGRGSGNGSGWPEGAEGDVPLELQLEAEASAADSDTMFDVPAEIDMDDVPAERLPSSSPSACPSRASRMSVRSSSSGSSSEHPHGDGAPAGALALLAASQALAAASSQQAPGGGNVGGAASSSSSSSSSSNAPGPPHSWEQDGQHQQHAAKSVWTSEDGDDSPDGPQAHWEDQQQQQQLQNEAADGAGGSAAGRSTASGREPETSTAPSPTGGSAAEASLFGRGSRDDDASQASASGKSGSGQEDEDGGLFNNPLYSSPPRGMPRARQQWPESPSASAAGAGTEVETLGGGGGGGQAELPLLPRSRALSDAAMAGGGGDEEAGPAPAALYSYEEEEEASELRGAVSGEQHSSEGAADGTCTPRAASAGAEHWPDGPVPEAGSGALLLADEGVAATSHGAPPPAGEAGGDEERGGGVEDGEGGTLFPLPPDHCLHSSAPAEPMANPEGAGGVAGVRLQQQGRSMPAASPMMVLNPAYDSEGSDGEQGGPPGTVPRAAAGAAAAHGAASAADTDEAAEGGAAGASSLGELGGSSSSGGAASLVAASAQQEDPLPLPPSLPLPNQAEELLLQPLPQRLPGLGEAVGHAPAPAPAPEGADEPSTPRMGGGGSGSASKGRALAVPPTLTPVSSWPSGRRRPSATSSAGGPNAEQPGLESEASDTAAARDVTAMPPPPAGFGAASASALTATYSVGARRGATPTQHIQLPRRRSGSSASSLQTSPSGSHAATHATQLLREASSAVDSTRHAVQRGDTVWLDMVSGTLKQVEAALEALTDFR